MDLENWPSEESVPVNGLEYHQHHLSITQADTDHDGINDGEEYHYWQNRLKEAHPTWSNATINATAIKYCLNPDVDGDGIPDGKEIHGYEVKIITGWSNGEPISRMRFISPSELDPLTPYKNKTGVYLDTDNDGIPDVVESWFSNSSIVTSYEYKEKFINKFGSVLFNRYSWVIGYYRTIEAKQNRSAADSWLTSQFNPLIRDHTPPVIVKFTLSWDVEWSWSLDPVKVYAKVHLIVRDVGGISYVSIYDENTGELVDKEDAGTSVEIEHKFRASALSATVGSVKLSVLAVDYAGNYISVEKELKGAFGQLLDALAKIWDAFWKAMQKFAQAVMSALNVLLEWIVNQISNAYMNFLEMYRDAFSCEAGRIDIIWNKYNDTGGIDKEAMREFWEDIVRVVYLSMTIWGVIMAILYIVMGLTFGLGSIVMSAIGMAIYGALSLSMESGSVPEWLVPGLSNNELVRKIAQDIGGRYNNSGVSREKIIEFFLSLFSMGLSFMGWMISAAEGDVTGTMAGLIAASVATAALIFAGVLNLVSGETRENIRWIVYGFSLVGIFMGVVGILKGSSAGNPVGVIISLIGMVIGILTMAISIAQGG